LDAAAGAGGGVSIGWLSGCLDTDEGAGGGEILLGRGGGGGGGPPLGGGSGGGGGGPPPLPLLLRPADTVSEERVVSRLRFGLLDPGGAGGLKQPPPHPPVHSGSDCIFSTTAMHGEAGPLPTREASIDLAKSTSAHRCSINPKCARVA
jgi:hypothetical protein